MNQTKNPFADCIRRGRELKEKAEHEKHIRHKKFLEAFKCKDNQTNIRHPNPEMI